MYGCERTIKKAEHWRIDSFELWCWRRLLRVPWTARRSNQSILKEISPEYSLEGLMLKLKFPYFGHLMRRTDSFEKTLVLGKIKGRSRRGDRGWDGWMASPTQWTRVWVNSGSCCWTGRPGVLQSMGSQESDATEQLYWTELILIRRASRVAQWVKKLSAMQETPETWLDFWAGKIPWRRARQPIPILLPEEFHGQSSLLGCSPWGCKESDMTEATEHST